MATKEKWERKFEKVSENKDFKFLRCANCSTDQDEHWDSWASATKVTCGGEGRVVLECSNKDCRNTYGATPYSLDDLTVDVNDPKFVKANQK